jgi:TetR/AcrR family transcriptional regulator, repressor of fatR-cypB operon
MRRHENILAATLDIITEQGIESVSVSQILKRAGVGTGTLYNYYPHKRTLLKALYRESALQLDNAIMQAYRSGGSPREMFARYLRGMAHALLKHPRELSFLESCRDLPGIDIDVRHGETLHILTGRALCRSSPLGDAMAYRFVTGALIAVVRGHFEGMYSLEDDEIERTIDACWSAVAPS